MLISGRDQKLLKVCHLMAVSSWIGGCIALITLIFASSSAQESYELYGILNGVRFVNVVVVVYLGGFASFFTGLAYSLCTNRGFFKYRWITLKWMITLFTMATGAIMLGPWSTHLLEIVDLKGIAALETPGYIRTHTLLLIFLGIDLALLFVATVLSVFKPWEDLERHKRAPAPVQLKKKAAQRHRATVYSKIRRR